MADVPAASFAHAEFDVLAHSALALAGVEPDDVVFLAGSTQAGEEADREEAVAVGSPFTAWKGGFAPLPSLQARAC